MGTPTLSSAMSRFTSEFGMGSGGTNSPLPPGKWFYETANYSASCFQRFKLQIFERKFGKLTSHVCVLLTSTNKRLSLELLELHHPITWVLYGQAARAISTG
jgi:hypothetical protein